MGVGVILFVPSPELWFVLNVDFLSDTDDHDDDDDDDDDENNNKLSEE